MADTGDACDPISTGELERRWAAVRAAMAERDIDVLVMQNNNAHHGGYVKYFTDTPALYGGYLAVLFPRNEKMIVLRHGPPGDITVKDGDLANRGVGRVISRPTFAAVDYTKDYHGIAAVEELRRLMPGTIGLVNTQTMAYPFLDRIRNGNLGNAKFVDATDMVDQIKAIKSPEEIDFIIRCAEAQDAAMEAVRKAIEPGKRVFELAALAQYVGQTLGSIEGLFLGSTAPLGEAVHTKPRHLQNAAIPENGQFTLLIENTGPNGFYTEIGRTFVLGKAPQRMLDEFAFTLEAQQFTLKMVKPGADPAEILARYNEFMRKNGRPEEKRLYAHGQGYDLVERPMFVAEETMKLAPNMNVVVHPTYMTAHDFSWICDNYLVTETGVSPSIHKTPQKIFEL